MTALLAENSAVLAHDTTFASLGVPAPLVAVLDSDGITVPFPIQAATLSDAMTGRDILGRAKTGSGKTLGFSLPLVTRLAWGGQTVAGRPRGLVLVPTRELATQVAEVLTPLARAMGLRVATIYGGVSYRPQINALQRRTDVLVACPGRLADLIGQGHCDLGSVEVTVIDEADQMADLGFLPIVRRLLEATPDDGQRMLFSATLDSAIDVLARRFLTDPALHSVDENSTPAEISHHVITINPAHRLDVLTALAGGSKRSLVFTRTKHGAERLARQLTSAGIPAAELHGNLAQGARSRNLAAFGTGAVRVMVATDIAARGIHVDGIDLVIHADPPAEHKAYVHRSGRTARGGADGVVVTMQTAAQAREVRRLMREAGVSPHLADAEPDSEVLREIAGPPVPRVTLDTKVTDLVKPAERFSGVGGERAGRDARAGRDGRDGRDGKRRGGKQREGAERVGRGGHLGRVERVGRGGHVGPAGGPGPASGPGRGGGPGRAGFAGRAGSADQRGAARRTDAEKDWERPDRFERRDRVGDGGRSGQSGRDRFGSREWDGFASRERAEGNERVRAERTPSSQPRGEQGAAARPSRHAAARVADRGGNWGGATARPGYSRSRTTPGKRRNPGQGRHF